LKAFSLNVENIVFILWQVGREASLSGLASVFLFTSSGCSGFVVSHPNLWADVEKAKEG
jgi:hypothetical protein